jgi:hypothetical protein
MQQGGCLEERGEAELDAIGQLARVPLRASEPSGADRLLVPKEVLDAQPRRHRRRATIVARRREARIRLLPGRDRLADPSQSTTRRPRTRPSRTV